MTAADWVTGSIAAIALVLSGWALVYSRRSTVAAERSAVASESSASTAAATLTENRRSADAAVDAAAAAERSADLADEALHPAPVVDLVITKSGGDSWVLRNVGAATARGVHHVDEVAFRLRLASGLDLGPGVGEQFMMAADMDNPLPPQLRFAWEGQAEPVAVRVPLSS